MNKIKIAIIGYKGKMGTLATELMSKQDNYTVVAKIGSSDNLDGILKNTQPDIAIELTSNKSVLENSQIIIDNHIRPVIGSSGLNQNEIDLLMAKCKMRNLGGLILPNFSLGVACLNKTALSLKEYFNDFSILEYHHRAKKDKPSGTARHIAHLLGNSEEEIAAIRSDGFVAKLQLYVNTPYERIMLDHESFDRKSFEPGILLSVIKVMELKELVVGLENII